MSFHCISRCTPVILLVTVVFSVAVPACERPQVGSPGYRAPEEDTSPYEPAKEFEYLVDIGGGLEKIEQMSESVSTGEGSPVSSASLAPILDFIGFPDLKKKEITAEANESMIRAHGVYELPDDSETVLGVLGEMGAAEVKFPAHFPRDRWVGHLFIARPGALAEAAFEVLNQSMREMQSQFGETGEVAPGMSFDLDFFASVLGFEEAQDIYDWMGEEALVFSITNPSFDPEKEPTPANSPFFTALAVATESADDGIQALDNIVQFWFATMSMMGLEKPEGLGRTRLEGHDAYVVPVPDFSRTPWAEMFTEEQLKALQDAPSTVAVCLPGYIVIGDEPSVRAVIEAFETSARGSGRMASVETQVNLDLVSDTFLPASPGYWIGLLNAGSPELSDLLQDLYEATRDIRELGTSTASILIRDGQNLELDVITSRESIRFFEAIQRVIEETPEETWEAIGRDLGEALKQQGGIGVPGGQDFEFDFPESD